MKGQVVRCVLLSALFFALSCPPAVAKTSQVEIPQDAKDKLAQFGVEKLLFVKRHTFQSTHFYTDFIDGCVKFGGNICVLSLKDNTVTELVPSMSEGIFGRYDLSFDGKRIVFGWKPCVEKGFRIYEVGTDGKGLRQLTFDPPDEQQRIEKYNQPWFELYNHHTDDMHPCYLPDGGICFTSSRCEYGILCNGDDTLSTTVIYRMDGDGGNMQKLTNSSVSEFSPTMLDDGRIMYSRWEYVDKGSLCIKSLWAMRPDGSGSTEIFGNNINLPPALIHGRPVPNQNNLFVCLGTPHFPQAGIGTVIRIDANRNIRTREPMTYITPAVDIRDEGGWSFRKNDSWQENSRGRGGRLYMDPYPLSKSLYLVSCKYDPRRRWNDYRAYDLYLLDEDGTHTLILDEPMISCWMPMPLRPRKKPPVLDSAKDPELAKQNLAVCVVADIYRGLDNVERGTIKYIRINEQVPRPWAARRDDGTFVITMGTHMGLKVQYGIVPVEEDGSAYFVVPADKNIFFQALDENFMEVQRERTYVNYRPGEMRSCLGCHEKPRDVLPDTINTGTLLALKRPPSKPGPQPGETSGTRVLHYPTDVQPVLDKHCVRCHGSNEPDADLDLTAKMTDIFSRSYENLLENDLVQTLNEDTLLFAEYMPPYTLGSHASKLINVLREGHEEVELSREEMIRLTTWVDSNAQYYGSYYGRRPLDYRNHPNFRPAPTFAEAISTTAPLPDEDR